MQLTIDNDFLIWSSKDIDHDQFLEKESLLEKTEIIRNELW